MRKILKLWCLKIFVKYIVKDMPVCVHPVFRKGKAGYDSWKIKGYSYTFLTPNKGTKDVVHLHWNDFGIFEDTFIDEEENIHCIEDTDQPFFDNWLDAYNDAIKKLEEKP